MYANFHLAFNFKLKVSHDIFQKKNGCQLTSIFNLNSHLNVINLVVCVVSISNVLIDVRFFPSQVALRVKF